MDNTCEICYKIVCKGCGWEPDQDEAVLIQKEILLACPQCGWSPTADLASKTLQ